MPGQPPKSVLTRARGKTTQLCRLRSGLEGEARCRKNRLCVSRQRHIAICVRKRRNNCAAFPLALTAAGVANGPMPSTVAQSDNPFLQGDADASGLETSATILLLLLALVALLGDRLLSWGARLGGRLGLDTASTLRFQIRAVQWTGGLILLGLIVHWLLSPLPGWVAPLLLFGALWLLLHATGLLGDLFGGLMIQFRFRVREGDYVTIGHREGEVLGIHALQLRIRTEGGSVYIPNRHFLREPVDVARIRHAYPFHYTMSLPRPLQEEDFRVLRERVVFLPYRVPGSPLRVRGAGGGQRLEVTCHLWDLRASELAEGMLRRACLDLFSSDEGKTDVGRDA